MANKEPGSSPDSAIRYKIEVVDSELKYSPEMDVKEEFFVDKNDINTWKEHNRFAHFRMIGETNSGRLSLSRKRWLALLMNSETSLQKAIAWRLASARNSLGSDSR